jgi:hypothetical protein
MINKFLNEKCPGCEGSTFTFYVKLFPATRYKDLAYAPLFIPFIGKACANCKRWIKWEKQTEELVSELNKVADPTITN